MTDDKDDWDVPVFEVIRKEGARAEWSPSPPAPPPLSHDQIEAFEDRCYLCFHRSWDVFESGAPMWSTCKHGGHQGGHYGGGEYKYIECSRVAEKYDGKKCPKFWPVLIRLPFRLAWRGTLRGLQWLAWKNQQR